MWRRWTPAVAAVLVSLVVGGCTSASVALHVHPALAAPRPSSRLPRCVATTLTAVGGRQGENGGAHGDIEFSNIGRVPCVLVGIPGVAILRADGSPLAVRTAPPTGPPVRAVVLQPGKRDAAWLTVYWSNWCGKRPGPLRIRIQLPGSSGALTAPFDGPPDYDYVPACLSSGLPWTIAVISAYGGN